MQNGYFQLVSAVGGGFGVKFIPPTDGGEPLRIGEVISYLDTQKLEYNIATLKQFLDSGKEIVCFLRREDCPRVRETYSLEVSPDKMSAKVRFYAPSEIGERMTFDEFITDLRYKGIVYGIQTGGLQDHFQSAGNYCTDIVIAQGKAPRHGKDAEIQYYFNTDRSLQPEVQEDGSVDYYNLNIINRCNKGDILARLIPADEGEYGTDIYGGRIKPREVKKKKLQFSNHVEQSEDHLTIRSMVNGHVMLVDGRVFVSDVYEVENVDMSTGNIEFEGSVHVRGNVATNFVVRAEGNVIIDGVVEGAQIYAGGNITIARGVNGKSKGTLRAGGNVVAKFIESAVVEAENGYVNTGSILHSTVSAGDSIVVDGKKGFVTGGHIQAGNKIQVKNLGAEMGAPTVVEVGVSPKLKEEYVRLQKESTELVKAIRLNQPLLANFLEKKAKGVRFTEEQLRYIRDTAKDLDTKKRQLQENNEAMTGLQATFEVQRNASVEVTGTVFPGTTIVIGDVSMVTHSTYKYFKFVKSEGEVKGFPL